MTPDTNYMAPAAGYGLPAQPMGHVAARGQLVR